MIRIPSFELPAALASIGERLPQWPHSIALAASLNAAGRLRVIDPEEFAILEDRVVRIRVLDAGACATVRRRGGVFRPVSAFEQADLTFSAAAAAYLQMVTRQEDPDTLFFNRRLLIEGDTELGLTVKNLLDRVELPRFLAGMTGAGR
jgi:O2-independent ubiquinone biosynthesis accessory factor UbiT